MCYRYACSLYIGPLGEVGDLKYKFISINKILVTWTPPFTLPGTVIIGYNVTVTIKSSNEKWIQDRFMTASQYTLHITDVGVLNVICSGISVKVSGYNGLNGKAKVINLQFNSGEFMCQT